MVYKGCNLLKRGNKMHFRSPKSLKNKLDLLIKKYGIQSITIEHGCACYEFHHYDYIEPNFENGWEESIIIYIKDFWNNNKITEFGRYNEKNLAKIDKGWGYYGQIYTNWDKRYPTIIEIQEYN